MLYGSIYPGFAIIITIMISDFGQIDLDIIEQSCAVNNEDRIATDVFVVPFDVSPEVCHVDFFSTKCFKKNGSMRNFVGIEFSLQNLISQGSEDARGGFPCHQMVWANKDVGNERVKQHR